MMISLLVIMVKMMVHMMKVMLMMICSKRTHCSRIAVLFVIQSHVQNTAGVLLLIDDNYHILGLISFFKTNSN